MQEIKNRMAVEEVKEIEEMFRDIRDDIQVVLNKYNITIEEAVEVYNNQRKMRAIVKQRKTQYYNDNRSGVWCYFIKGEMNPCGCGSNCYHYEQDVNTGKIYGVCNACEEDIYEVKEEYVSEHLEKGIWK